MEQKVIQFNKGIYRSPSQAQTGGELSECINLIPKNGELVGLTLPVRLGSLTIPDGYILVHKHQIHDESGAIDNRLIITNPDDGVLKYEDGSGWTELENVRLYNIKGSSVSGKVVSILHSDGIFYMRWDGNKYIKVDGIPKLDIGFYLNSAFYTKRYGGVVKLIEQQGRYEVEQTVVISAPVTSEYILNVDTKAFIQNRTYKVTASVTSDLYIYYTNGQKKRRIVRSVVSDESIIQEPGLTIDKITIKPWQGSLQGEIVFYGFDASLSGDKIEKTEENWTALHGMAKDYIYEQMHNNKHFVAPFFVRYGIKLTDGSIVHQSSPMLMIPNEGIFPLVISDWGDDVVYSFVSNLKMEMHSNVDIESMRDIVAGLVVAVSNPIYRYNQGADLDTDYEKVEVVPYYDTTDLYGVGWYNNFDGLHDYNVSVEHIDHARRIILPSFAEDEYIKKFLDTSTFFIIKEFSLDEMPKAGEGMELDLSDVDIFDLSTLPQMPDDYNSLNSFSAETCFTYNNRLTISNISEIVENGIRMCSPILRVEGDSYWYEVDVKEDGKTGKYVSPEYPGSPNKAKWFYFPDTHATSAKIVHKHIGSSTQYFVAELALKQHSWLMGAYCYGLYGFNWEESDDVVIPGTTVPIIKHLPNSLFSSAVNNPFYFPAALQQPIGTGTILATSTTTKPLSEGQLGQTPLYAFTTDGIWALFINPDGTFKTPNPLNRDVLVSQNVCQTDDAVVYASYSGLKMLSGNEAILLSGNMEGANINENGLDTSIPSLDGDRLFIDWLMECRLVYEATEGRRLHIYSRNETDRFHYVLSLDDFEVSTMIDDKQLISFLPDFPHTLLHLKGGDGSGLYQFMTNANTGAIEGLILTRPISFDNPYALKMLHDLRLDYSRNGGSSCKVKVFVSNDRKAWKRLTSLRKHSFKWYRFLIDATLAPTDALTSMICLTEERFTNKLR